MRSDELRAAFVDFFVERGHRALPAATLIPDAMSTTLFTIAGMEQFVPVFLGETPAPAPRAVTVQRCLRVAGAKSDIENVGRTGRHGTFLEMLGNFSFGDYFKREAIGWAWEFLTQTLKLDHAKIAVTVHTDDDEAQEIWEREIGIPRAKITRFDEDNFWTMGATGPCGPCSELFYDTGPPNAAGPDDTGPNLGNRFVEIWNLVFQQFNRTHDGQLHKLPRTGIDTGAGFERLLAVANGKASMYETDLFADLIAAQPAVGSTSLDAREQLVRRRIVADHARAVTFLIADGVYPSNVDRGYVLRFLIRRAILQGRLLGYPAGFLTALVPAVVDSLASGYPALRGAQERVIGALGAEETTFGRTLERGADLFERKLDELRRQGSCVLSGADVFTLHDTYGFPAPLTRELAGEAGFTIDESGFEQEMEAQRRRARADTAAKRGSVGVSDVAEHVVSTFHGYESLESAGTIRMLLRDDAPVDELIPGERGVVIVDATSFYAERGGQIGDRGTIRANGAVFAVDDVQYRGEAIAHHGVMREGIVRAGERVKTAVDPSWREEIRRHHTSAHLLQRALRDVLGDAVAQAGSWVGPDRMRFDFRSPVGALSEEQKRAVARRVNEIIREDHRVRTEIVPIAQALETGAITMTGEKYGETVRVLHAGPSVELCGGTHAHSTGELGFFVMLSETSVGSGIRRIEAVVSRAAEAYVESQRTLVAALGESLSAAPEDLTERVDKLQQEVKTLQRARGELAARLAAGEAAALVGSAETIGGKRVVLHRVADSDGAALRTLSNAIRSRLGSGVIALAGIDGETVSLFVSASDDLVRGGVHAGNLIKAAAPLVGGRGGGAPAQAQGGGKDPSGADAALRAIREALA